MNRARTEIRSRQDRILWEIEKEGVVYIADLCKKCNVTDMTIRRDLSVLEARGMLKRFHGGAKIIKTGGEISDAVSENTEHDVCLINMISERISKHAREKDEIAKRAASMIGQGEVIFLNSGTTGLYLLRYLGGKNVRIVSNNAAMALIDRSADTELTITGGEHFVRTQSFVGPLAKNILTNVVADKCFLSVSGISSVNGITCSSLQETEINNLMIQHCKGKRIVIADGSKVGVSFSFISCKISDIDTLITDRFANMEELDRLRACGIDIILADEEPG